MESLLMGDIDCRRFARHVATQGGIRSGGMRETFHFFVHWILCAACRQYEREIMFLGATLRKATGAKLPEGAALVDLQNRLLKNIKSRFRTPPA